MTDLPPPAAETESPADTEPPAAPPTCEQIAQEAAERPKSLRLLPRITADGLRLVWAANPRMLVASIWVKLGWHLDVDVACSWLDAVAPAQGRKVAGRGTSRGY